MRINRKIAKEINEMAKKDQELRKVTPVNEEELKAWDGIHKRRVKEIVDTCGLITISKFGKKASFNTWLLIQHFPETDIDFMERYLQMMEQNLKDIDRKNYAYLKDRICLYRGVPQIFGTQTVGGKFHSIDNIEGVDRRRVEYNLEPLSEYVEKFKQVGVVISLPDGYVTHR